MDLVYRLVLGDTTGPVADTAGLAYGPGAHGVWHRGPRYVDSKGTARARGLATSETVSSLQVGPPLLRHSGREREKRI